MSQSLDLEGVQDGDSGPIYTFTVRDQGAIRDGATFACEFKIEDQDGNVVSTRPGVLLSPKTSGQVQLYFKGRECDYDGAGSRLIVKPRIYYATALDGTPAVNVLVNPSFDTYTGGAGVADSWTLQGTLGPEVYEVLQDGASPRAVFGKVQRIYVPTTGSTGYIRQLPAITSVAGDYISGGLFLRAKLDVGAGLIGEPGYYLRLNDGVDSVKSFLAAGDRSWSFNTIEMRTAADHTVMQFAFVPYDAIGYDMRIDEAFMFKGRWRIFHADPIGLPVVNRSRVSKASSSISGIDGVGGFENDSDGNGVADGWLRYGATNTYTMERDPDNLNTLTVGVGASLGAQKIVVAASTADRIRLVWRGKYKSGETWRFQVYYKNAGALSGAPANGDFGIVLHTEEFDGPYEESSLAGANFSLGSIAAYIQKFRTLALTADRSVLVLDINLKTASGGTLWLDDAKLYRTVAAP